ncbi:hypothetical protein GI374_18625 [Paracoccus sp. S-4012]|nr:hypothetical protein [Paracoccus sp. S-4012]
MGLDDVEYASGKIEVLVNPEGAAGGLRLSVDRCVEQVIEEEAGGRPGFERPCPRGKGGAVFAGDLQNAVAVADMDDVQNRGKLLSAFHHVLVPGDLKARVAYGAACGRVIGCLGHGQPPYQAC